MSADLRLGDCLDPVSGLAGLPDGSVDVAISDPPYSEHTHAKVRRGGSFHAPDVTTGGPKRPVISTSVVLGFDSLSVETREAAARELARLAKRWILIFSDERSSHLWADALERQGLEYVRTCFWDKEGGTPQFTGDRPAIACEMIVVAHRPGRKHWNGGGKRGIYRHAIKGGDRVHTTQKPLDLMEALVRDFTDPGEMVCDPFAGSGTTLVACKRLGRNAIGWEKDPKFHAAAVKRIEDAREQFQLPRLERKPKQSALALPDDAEGAA